MPDTDNTPALPEAADVQISLRMPAALLAQIDAAARELGLNRAGMIRMTLTRAMRAPKGD